MMNDKTLFVTGAAAGIGREAARLFHARGYAVGLYDVDVANVERLAAELGARCTYGALDVTDASAFASAAAAFHERFGRFDVLLNNAGVLTMGPFADLPLEAHRRTIDVNVNGVIHGMAAALPHLRVTARAHGEARIINMASASTIYGTPDHSTYSASKAAVRALTEALSFELASDGIRVCDVLPSYVDTAMVTAQATPSMLVAKMGIAHTAHEVAELIWHATTSNEVHVFGNRALAASDRVARLLPGLTRRAIKRMR